MTEKMTAFTPDQEYLIFKQRSTLAGLHIVERNAFLLANKKYSKDSVYVASQFASLELMLVFYSTKMNRLKNKSNRVDTSGLTIDKLAEFRREQNHIVYADLRLTDSILKIAKFRSNKMFLSAYHTFLSKYENSYSDKFFYSTLLKHAKLKDSLHLASGTELSLLEIDSTYYRSERQKYL